jgi:hypothetical protein
VIAVDGQPLLSSDETETSSQLEQEGFEAIDDGLLEVAFLEVRAFLKIEELEHERILDHVARLRDGLAGLR